MNIALYSDDVNLLSHWEKSLGKNCEIFEDIEILFALKNTIIIINYSACIGGCESVLKRLNVNLNRVLILHRTPSFEVAKELLKMGAFGYGNALMNSHFVVSAINAIKEGMVWLYPEYTSQLILGLDESDNKNKETLLSPLSPRERDTALLLKDGLTYNEVAQRLDITPRTVKAHAQKIYTKLQVKDRLALALLLK
ncbi:MAG: response regulator transcription factor [Campylobacterales bacterium]|nr:response regulator transcription factor [Campylobacterales bacterium]